MTKQITIDFYRLSIYPEGSINFEDICQKVFAVSIKDRLLDINNHQVWLHTLKKEDQFITGDMIKLRMNNLPSKGDLAGNIENLDFEEDEGVAEHTAFIYHKKTRVLLIQRTKEGIDLGNLKHYLEEIFSKQVTCVETSTSSSLKIIDKNILDIDAIKHLSKSKEIHKFEIKIARPDNLDSFLDIDTTVEELWRINEELNSLTIEVNLSIGNKKNNSLDIQKIINITKSLLKINGHDPSKVKKITAKTREEGAERAIFVNLLSNLVKEKVEVNINNNRNKTLLLEIRLRALKDAWARREQQIKDMFIN